MVPGPGVLMKALLVTASLCLGAAPALARDDNPNIDAIWMPQVVSFTYQADDTFYTCSSLWQKVTGILAHLGARATAPVDRLRCDDFAHTVRLQIALESPAEATAANLLAVTSYDSEDMLVARLRRKQVLPKLAVQVLNEPTRCTAILSRGGMPPKMKVRALTVAG